MSDPISRNKHAYDLWSSIYDSYPNSTVAMDDVHFPQVWSHLIRKSVLEIGCGTGRHTQRLVAQKNQVTALDLSSGMLAIARGKLPQASATLIEADFMTFSGLQAEGFDAAICSLVVEHIEDIESFFRKVAGLLKPHGEFFLSEIHPLRASSGSQAHFKDPSSGSEVYTASYPHSDSAILDAADRAGLRLIRNDDIIADEGLARNHPGWERYIGLPMIKIWAFALAN